uniref:RING-type domain-containing protein n=2 Tax=Cryptococcus bacillisporus CA1280 TaxID=1296109 RepID=A0A0D0TD48_CRYGA|nr:hypothetical protein I312_06629 [Cryptococcus bacillisporus CA1280]
MPSAASPPSPHASLRPRPTIADVPIAPRRRLRDGSRAGSVSSGRSIGASKSGSRESSRSSSSRAALMAPAATSTTSPAITSGAPSRSQSNAAQEPIEISESENESDNGSSDSIVAIPPQVVSRGRTPANLRRPRITRSAATSRSGTNKRGTNQSTPVLVREDTLSSSDEYAPRYTTQEKGKGRAVPSSIPIEISSDEDDELLGLGSVKAQSVEIEEDEGTGLDESSALGTGYHCPICFNAPNPAVLTPCGHILCAGCLHSSLLAAIRRNPNPYPNPLHGFPHRGRGRGHARGSTSTRRRYGSSRVIENQPTHWTADILRQTYIDHKTAEMEQRLVQQKWPEEERDAAIAGMFGEMADVQAREVLNGLWTVDGKWVVEGECPVCRKGLAGGYGPPNSGIGGVIPLQAKLSTALLR